MPRYPCPICRDPDAYPLWIDTKPPQGCPEDTDWQEGRARSIHNVGECPYQRGKAEQRARWMKLCREAFDDNGNLVEGGLVKVLNALPPGSPPVIF